MLLIGTALAAGPFQIEFEDMDGLVPLTFPKIDAHTVYSIESGEDGNTYLCALANASASGLVIDAEFDVYSSPVLTWRWRVSNVYKEGYAGRKEGDDFPARIYVMFSYDPKGQPLGTRLAYGYARIIYGEYPPHSSLNYVWASRRHPERYIESPYTDKAQLVIMRSGQQPDAGLWQWEEVDMVADYREAFGMDPPRYARIAVMSDSDNTGELAVAHFDSIQVRSPDE